MIIVHYNHKLHKRYHVLQLIDSKAFITKMLSYTVQTALGVYLEYKAMFCGSYKLTII